MLSKTLQFDDDVLEVLRIMVWSDEGKQGLIQGGQLERGLYVRVNKALEAMGGKWNKGLKAHLFKTDPRSQVEGLLGTGELTVVRDGFFETPPEVVGRMIELVQPTGNVLEPSAGLGAIADRLPILKDRVLCIEKNEQRAAELCRKGYRLICLDFLDYEAPGAFDAIFMNPPFEDGQDIVHVMHAYECLEPGGAMVSVMSEGPFFREDRKAVSFRKWLESVGGESEKLPGGSFKQSGTGVNARLVVIRRKAVHG
jgi:hypothetical protein